MKETEQAKQSTNKCKGPEVGRARPVQREGKKVGEGGRSPKMPC